MTGSVAAMALGGAVGWAVDHRLSPDGDDREVAEMPPGLRGSPVFGATIASGVAGLVGLAQIDNAMQALASSGSTVTMRTKVAVSAKRPAAMLAAGLAGLGLGSGMYWHQQVHLQHPQ